MRALSITLLIIVSLFAARFTASQARPSLRWQAPVCDRLYFLHLPHSLLNLFSFGHLSLLRDINYFFTLSNLVPGRENRPEKACLQKQLDDLISLPPKMESIYMLACFTVAMDYKSPESCEKIIQAGMDLFPKSWRLPFTQGFIFSFRQNNKERGALYFQLAAQMPGAPNFLPNLVRKFSANPNFSEKEQKEILKLILKGN